MNNEEKKEISAFNQFRIDIGVQIIEAMEANEDLPLPNKYRLAKVMQEYYYTMGLNEDVLDSGYKWKPKKEYWIYKLNDISKELRTEKQKYFIFVHTEGGRGFEGLWKFATEEEYIQELEREHKETGTRIENHNDKLTDGQKKWAINLPKIDRVPLLN